MVDAAWNNEDAAWLRRQLNTKTGKTFMALLRSLTPVIKAKELEAMGIEALRRQTWEEVLDAIAAAAAHDEAPTVQETPFVDVNVGMK